MSSESCTPDERVLVYAGLSISPREVGEWIPDAVIRPPAKQGDVLSDMQRYDPTHILLLDGCFRQNLAVWIKELVYALASGVKVYGSSSMGALRAAELFDLGMMGAGRVFSWYHESAIENDAAVAVAFQQDQEGNCHNVTVSDVDLYATREWKPDWEPFLLKALKVPWWERSVKRIQALPACPPDFQVFNVKWKDALELVQTFRMLKPFAVMTPHARHLGILFNTQHERERRVDVGKREIPLQAIDATVALNAPDRHELFADASNRALAVVLADVMGVGVNEEELNRETARFCARKGLMDWVAFQGWLKSQCMSQGEFDRMMLQETRIYKLYRALITERSSRRRTQDVLDYLRVSGRFEKWANEAALRPPDKELFIDGDLDPELEWRKLSKEKGIPIDRPFCEWLREYGFIKPEEAKVEIQKEMQFNQSDLFNLEGAA